MTGAAVVPFGNSLGGASDFFSSLGALIGSPAGAILAGGAACAGAALPQLEQLGSQPHSQSDDLCLKKPLNLPPCDLAHGSQSQAEPHEVATGAGAAHVERLEQESSQQELL